MSGLNVIKKFNDHKVDTCDIVKMCSAIAHRGPDDAGYAMLDNGRLGLGHVHLSIMDTEREHQPIFNKDCSICIICDGWICDHMELKDELVSKGYQFTGTSNCEVILHLYEEYGIDFLKKLNGEFALVIWDQNRNYVLVARDRKGIKPLYYYYDNNELVISSEAKGIFVLQRIPRSISNLYLTGPFLGIFPSAFSTFSNIHHLKPGHFLIVDHKGPQDEKPYWEQTYETDASLSFEDAKEGVRHFLTQAVKRRMIADDRVGMCLSGGIDSTIVCGLMANLGQSSKAFNIGFGGSVYDESEVAGRVANHFGMEFESIDCQMDTLAEEFTKTLYHVEQALFNPAAIGRLQLSGLIRSQGYKNSFIGDGGDEQFCGYPYFKLEKLWRMIQAGGEQAESAKELLKKFQLIEKRSEGIYWTRVGSSQLKDQLFGYPCFHQIRASEAQSRMHQIFDSKKLGLKDDDGPYHIFADSFNHEYMKSLDPVNAARLISWNDGGYTGPAHGDRVEMANSVESRLPILDNDLIDFSGRIPPEYLMEIETLQEKYVFREAFDDLIPEFIKREHKHPHMSPDWHLFSKTRVGKELVDEYLSKGRINEAGIFNYKFITLTLYLLDTLSQDSVIRKQLDVLFGMMLGVQVLQDIFINRPIQINPNFKVVDRTPKL